MKTICWFGFILCLTSVLCAETKSSPQTESIEMRAVLFSRCLQAQQKDPPDLWPIRVVDATVQKLGDKVSIQYRESDETCGRAFSASREWTVQEFEKAKRRLKKAGMRDGKTIAPPESSGNEWPISFLKVQSPRFKADVYTMYLRFRWTGKMKTEDPNQAKILDEWRSLLQAATPGGADTRISQ